MQCRHGRRESVRCARQESAAPLAGIVLIALGLALIFLCIPGWAWAALAGAALILLGYALLRRSTGRR